MGRTFALRSTGLDKLWEEAKFYSVFSQPCSIRLKDIQVRLIDQAGFEPATNGL